RSAASIFCRERSNPSLPLSHANYEGLALFSAISAQSATSATLAPTAVVHFIDFYAFALSAKTPLAGFIQHGANLFKHAPCGFIGHSGFALNLFCRNSATGGSHQIDGIKPRRQWSRRFVKDRVSSRVNMVTAEV